MNFINEIKTKIFKYRIKSNNNGIEFILAETPDEKEEIYKLRYEIYCKEKKYLKIEDYPNGLEQDNYDEISDHFMALNKLGKVVGTLRLVPREKNIFNEKKLPLEHYTDITKFINDESNIREVSRFTIHPDYRTRYLINFGLIKKITLYALAEGITDFAISTSVSSKNYFAKFGYKQVGEPYMYEKLQYKLPSITMLLSLQEALKLMRELNSSFYNYFTNK